LPRARPRRARRCARATPPPSATDTLSRDDRALSRRSCRSSPSAASLLLARSLFGPYDVADPDDTLAENLRAQPAAMDERRHDAVAREAVQVLARLAEPRAAQPHLADAEHAVQQVVERYTARRHVAKCMGRRDLYSEVARRVGRLGHAPRA